MEPDEQRSTLQLELYGARYGAPPTTALQSPKVAIESIAQVDTREYMEIRMRFPICVQDKATF